MDELQADDLEVSNRSAFSGKVHTLRLPITHAQIAAWLAGATIQHAMPHLSPSEREFLITGVTEDEWAVMEAHAPEDGDA